MRTSTPSPLNARVLRISDFCRIYSLGRSSTYVLIKEGKLASVVIAPRGGGQHCHVRWGLVGLLPVSPNVAWAPRPSDGALGTGAPRP